jgi:hypothetical protein
MPPSALTLRELNRATLARQGLLQPLPPGTVAESVLRLGSIQAQHPDWPPLALATRLDPGRAAALDAARRDRSVVRASLMRMTVHVVSSSDYWPMTTISLPLRVRQWRLLFKQDPVTSPLGRRLLETHALVVAALRDRPLRIRDIETLMASQLRGIDVPPNRSLWRHFSATVPLVLVPYPEEAYGRALYAPAAEWLPAPTFDDSDPQRAAVRVAERYLAAFGPANADDLAQYVGRGRDATLWRSAVKALGDRLVELRDPDGRALYDLADAPRPDEDAPAPPRLLARWDSLLLAYGTRDRARVLPPAHQATVITRNADVLPTFLVDGFVAGTWLPRIASDGTRRAELRPFGTLADATREALEEEASRLLPLLRSGAFSHYPGSD